MPIDFVLVPAVDVRSPDCAVSSSFFFDPGQSRRHLSAAVAAGFSGVSVDDAAGPLANLDIAANVARWNRFLDIGLTHWAGVTSPEIAAADIAALDRMTGGRLSLRLVADGAAETVDASDHLSAWQRTDEYLTLLKRLWSNATPIDHEGAFYRLRGACVPDKGPRGLDLPIRMTGRSGTALEVAARHATTFELPDDTVADDIALIERVRNAAARCGRAGKLRFAATVRVHDAWFSWGVAALSRYVAAGVTEFMVCGLGDMQAIERFGSEVVEPLGREDERRHPYLADIDSPRRALNH